MKTDYQLLLDDCSGAGSTLASVVGVSGAFG
jgi:hypothetical protein